MIRRLILAAALVAIALAEQTRYDGYKVFHVLPTEEQLSLLDPFQNHPGYDFWSRSRHAGHPVDIMVSPTYVDIFEEYLVRNKMTYQIIIHDVQMVFDAERLRQMTPTNATARAISFSKYLTVDEINSYLTSLASSYPSIVSVESIGRSYEGRPLNMIKISSGGGGSRPVILIDAGIHAREWIAPAMALYVINQLVESGNHKDLYASVDWHIIPVINPDGYAYSHSTTRLWRKTRSQTSNSRCPGVDANRNFGFHWMEVGASSSPCDETFAGSKAFSEPETAALQSYTLANKNRIKLYLTFHSYGNYLLYPWGYTSTLPSDWKTLDDLAKAANSAQVAAGGDRYTIGSSTNVLYAAAGGSDDWVKGVGGVSLSYTIELPGGGWYGFDLPASSISSTVKEFFPAVRVFGEYVTKNY
ncbi:carboxypeptidase B [Anabrus simplex]|uniref:carboxypeptidase B n=1 Tax=Anabrus simplex TaxID=316456 RepID=UPI0035A3D0C7